MSLPKSENFPDDPDLLPPARRRRARRLLAPLDADERAATIDHLARRTSPSFDFFLFSLVAGVFFGIGLLFDSPILLVLGAIFAPLMAPAVGVALGTIIGSYKFFFRSLIGLLIGSALVFIGSALIGIAARFWVPVQLTQAYLYAQLSWTNFILLTVGAVFTAVTMAHEDRSPSAPSVALAYVIYLPVAVAGFGLSSGAAHLFPDGLVLAAVHLAWVALLGALALAVLGFRPMTLFGYTLSGAVVLVGVILLIGFSAFSAVFGAFGEQLALPTPTPSATPTVTPIPPTLTQTMTPVPPSLTPTLTLTPTRTPTVTFTASPTPLPIYALVEPDQGACLREGPDLQAAAVGPCLLKDTLVQILPETAETDGYSWVKVIVVQDGRVGWMLQDLLLVATPEPQW